MKQFELTEDQFQELMRLCRLYRREADRSMDAKAYLAGCVMIGAALEAGLLATCDCYSDEIPEELIPKQKNGKPKHLLDWTFFQLLRLARECGWLPAHLNLHEDWDEKRADIGDYAVVLKDMRNLVHPSCHIADFPESRVTKRRMEMCFEILEVASTHLQAKLHQSLKVAMEEEEKKTPNESLHRIADKPGSR
jgi:hypothetical protein